MHGVLSLGGFQCLLHFFIKNHHSNKISKDAKKYYNYGGWESHYLKEFIPQDISSYVPINGIFR